jgi:hypothetical protein
MATRKSPSYCVEIVGQGYHAPFVTTLYTARFDRVTQDWWYTKTPHLADSSESSSA